MLILVCLVSCLEIGLQEKQTKNRIFNQSEDLSTT